MELALIVCIDSIHADGAIEDFKSRGVDCVKYDSRRILFEHEQWEWFGEFLQKHVAYTDYYRDGYSTLTDSHYKSWGER